VNPRQLDASIRGTLRPLGRRFWNSGADSRTRTIKNRIGSLSPSGVTIYANRCKYERNREFVFDMTWLVLRDGYIESVPLVMESEWRRGQEIHNDFQKLMIARAGLRIMIFGGKDCDSVSDQIWELKQEVARCGASRTEDRYLLAGFSVKEAKFKFESLGA